MLQEALAFAAEDLRTDVIYPIGGDDHRFGHFVIPAKAGIQKGRAGFPPSRE
jgi:hypothetical protein